jgi:hypothetical protein
MFALDICELLSNASKKWPGMHKQITKRRQKIDFAVVRILGKNGDEHATA